MQRFESTLAAAFAGTKDSHRLRKALQLAATEIRHVEESAEQPPRVLHHQDRPWWSERLQPGRQVRRLPDDAALLRFPLAHEIADDHQPGRDSDPHLERPRRL